MLDSLSSEEDLEEVEDDESNHVERVCHDRYLVYCYLSPV
jgi:hypothetical protein